MMKKDSSNSHDINLSKTNRQYSSDVILLAILTVVFESILLDFNFNGNVISLILSFVLLFIYIAKFDGYLCSCVLPIMASVLIYMLFYYSVINQFDILIPALSILFLCSICGVKEAVVSLCIGGVILTVIESSFQDHSLRDVARSSILLILNVFMGIILSKAMLYYRIDEFKRKRGLLSIVVHDIKSAFSVNYSYASTVMDLVSKRKGSFLADIVKIVSNKSRVVDMDEFSRLTVEVASRSKKEIDSIVSKLQNDV